ncbi:hypothetical protein CPT_MTx_092 [Serratia phage MTx]|uniref:Uncharacterized protein n=1 Tax=Serratia phage MTx TaxID=2557553 RepID=A0A482MGL5_9CAUD|nr:hypothetical protein HWC15_gp092 [Serratia phage MTx]QBQ72398.1 hypothetical protein CPT_MTx_092 [Serratia phage MTx]
MNNYEAVLRAQLLMARATLKTLEGMDHSDTGTRNLWNIVSDQAEALRVELAAALVYNDRVKAGTCPVPPYLSPLTKLDGLEALDFKLSSCDGKYETFMDKTGLYNVNRNGEPWMNRYETAGNKYVTSLIQLIETLDHKCKYYSDLARKAAGYED